MSDFVTELRREVVGGHARHRTGAARTRRRRRQPILAGAVALAALLAAVVLGVRSIPPPERPTEPRVVKLLRIGGNPVDGTFAAGSLWVADFGGHRLLRIDPARRKVTARIPVGNAPENIAAAGASLWVNSSTTDGTSVVWRIDGAKERVVDRFDAGYVIDLAATPRWLWLTRRDHQHSIDVRSPADGHRVGRIPAAGVNGLTAGGGDVWFTRGDGTVGRVGGRSGKVEHSWPQLAPDNVGWGSHAIAADRRGAWIADSAGGRLLRLEGDEIVRSLRIGESQPIIAETADGLWVVTGDEPSASSIARIDPRTGEVTARIGLGKHYPRALVPVRGGLWVIAGDGTVVLVAG